MHHFLVRMSLSRLSCKREKEGGTSGNKESAPRRFEALPTLSRSLLLHVPAFTRHMTTRVCGSVRRDDPVHANLVAQPPCGGWQDHNLGVNVSPPSPRAYRSKRIGYETILITTGYQYLTSCFASHYSGSEDPMSRSYPGYQFSKAEVRAGEAFGEVQHENKY